MVRDAEGGSRVVHLAVSGAADETSADRLARAVCASDLWRAAVHGADPNWGRVLSALGSVDRDLDLTQVELNIGPVTVFATGEPVAGVLEDAAKAMDDDEFELSCRVGSGPGKSEMWTVDLSPDYVRLNAWGTT